MYGYVITERREVEAREKERAHKEKMERERIERERRERERDDRIRQEQDRARREMEEKHRQKSQVDEHFDRSIRLAQQKHGGGEGVGHHHYLMQQSQLPGGHLPNANAHHNSHHRTQQQQQHHHHQQQQQQQQQHHQSKASSYQSHAQAQKAAGGWSQIPMVKPGDERLLDHRLAEQRRHEDSLRRAVEPVKMVQDSIYKAFRTTEQDSKSHYPPPAHSSKPPDKTQVSALPKLADPSFNLSSNYYHKDPKLPPHPSERVPFVYHDPRDKNSVIIKSDSIPPHSASPKQRPHERSSPYAPSSAYKAHEPPSGPHRSSLPHHHSPHSVSPHSVEISKARQPQISPHSVPSPAHAERAYYPPVSKPPTSSFPTPGQSFNITAGLVPNPMHVSAMPPKAKVNSPPPQHVYGKPGITSGTPVCRVDTRVSQPQIPLTTKPGVGGPPPAHSGPSASRGHPEPRSMNPHHEQRSPYERVPYDGRSYPPTVPSPHHIKHVVAPGPPPAAQARLTPVSSPHLVTAHIPHPGTAQTQPLDLGKPLDLGTREDTASPHKRRTHTPTPQDTKKPRYESVPSTQQPTLSRVSEPSPLYPTAATTITTVENTVAIANLSQRVSSPVSRPSSHPSAAGTPTLHHPDRTHSPSLLKQTQQQLQHQIHQQKKDDQQFPSDPDKSNSPGPAGYIHKLKKAWLQRHETVADNLTLPTSTSVNTSQSNNSSNNSTTNNSPQLSPQPTITSTINSSKLNITDSKSDKNLSRKNLVNNSLPNGHSQGSKSIKDEESDSLSDSDGNSSKSSGKRKHKRKKQHRRKGSDSNLSDSDKDSDTSASSGKKSGHTSSKEEPHAKKRGRKPKSKTENKIEDGPKPKKPKEEPPQNDPLQKPPIAHLKKTGESFLQDGSCYEVAPKLPKCRECRWTAHQRNKRNNIFCRFYAFRRLRYTKNGQLAVAGFSDPVKDASAEDTALWTPNVEHPPAEMDVETSKFLISHVGDQFCDLVQSEKEGMAMQAPEDVVLAWKRVVQGVREMCDVCETTLFNVHWACSKCGFVVCLDCYKGRKHGTVKTVEEPPKDRDECLWLLCASRVAHEPDKLMLTQIISNNALLSLGKKVHEVRHQWGIPQHCECPDAKKYKEETTDDKKKVNGLNKDLLKTTVKKEVKPEIVNGVVKTEKENLNGKDEEMSNSPLNFFADVALSNDKRDESSDSDSDSSGDEKGNFSTLRELLIRPNAKSNGSTKDGENGGAKPVKDGGKKKAKVDSLDDVISAVTETNGDKDEKKADNDMVLKHFVRKYNYVRHGREPLPIRIMTKVESSTLYPKVPHSWLCDGKLLRLLDSQNPNNKEMFQDMWKRGQPVIVSNVGHKLNQDIWKPSAFSKDFGEIKNDLINCLTGNIVPNQPMKKFWDGFDHYSKRLKDEKGQPMVLKLKDWPPTDDFAELLPSRFNDLMEKLPMGEYTRRNGILNLAGRLPDSFVRPDLGPKMYIAYGSSLHPKKASTNLHLDISDAANVMCYVGVPKDADYSENIKEAYKAIDDAGCDILTRRRVREKDEIPGALWHIYHARDSDKIRDFLNKAAIERGDRLEPHHDPIHDQSWYLDRVLRDRLYKDYGVEGYAIVQCYGDAVFIPAGAPHQVRNLHNCVKVAEDFVSPENVAHCFHLTQEFRHLSDTHTNHEDKLQIKNIIYHQMKDALAVLMAASKKEQMELKEETSIKEEKIEIKRESDT